MYKEQRHVASDLVSEERSRRRTDIVRRQRAISQRQMAERGIANGSIAKTSEVKSSPWGSPHKFCHGRDPKTAWILLENETVSYFPETGLGKKLTEPYSHITLSCFSVTCSI